MVALAIYSFYIRCNCDKFIFILYLGNPGFICLWMRYIYIYICIYRQPALQFFRHHKFNSIANGHSSASKQLLIILKLATLYAHMMHR